VGSLEFKQRNRTLRRLNGAKMDIFSPVHILLIVGIVVLLFGPSKFAQLGKGLGEGIRNFKSEMKKTDDEPKKP
jgi:sec-independent protein translocase protein TatA